MNEWNELLYNFVSMSVVCRFLVSASCTSCYMYDFIVVRTIKCCFVFFLYFCGLYLVGLDDDDLIWAGVITQSMLPHLQLTIWVTYIHIEYTNIQKNK